MAAVAVLRIWLDVGHGLSNARPNIVDPGAVSAYGSEHEIVSRLVTAVADRFWRDTDATVSISVTPSCSVPCLARHALTKRKRPSGHLAEKVRFVNDNLKRNDGRPFGEILLSVHMNAATSPDATGVEVLVSDTVPHRKVIAGRISAAIAASLGIRDRGGKLDTQARGQRYAILRQTDCPAYLVELGFVTNPEDVLAVNQRGVEALIAAIEQIAKEHK